DSRRLPTFPFYRRDTVGFLPPDPTADLHARLRSVHLWADGLPSLKHPLSYRRSACAPPAERRVAALVWSGGTETPSHCLSRHAGLGDSSRANRGGRVRFGTG